jgi:predicted ATPase/class 3 adenylate cyclase
MPEWPTGTVSLVFSDIAGSTRLLRQIGHTYGDILEQHRRLLRQAFADYAGREVDTQGDGTFAVFPTARDAVAAAVAAQLALAAHHWPDQVQVRLRMGIHTGEPTATSQGYVGMDVHKAARISAAGHGGQILLSQTTRDLAVDHLPPGVELRDLGEHRLKDIEGGQRLFQVVVPGLPGDFPPLRTLANRPSNLPELPTPLVGRERELGEVTALLRTERVRLVTLTGPGGTGKTRLALHAASTLLDDVRDGVCFVSLEPITDPALVAPTIAAAAGVRQASGPVEDRLREELRDRETLLVLDNFEQVVAAAPLVAGLLSACPRLRALATSREVLRLSDEHEYHVEPLPLDESVRLFEQRARSVRPGFTVTMANEAAIAGICRHLDGLPLAVELAAARMKLLSPEEMAARLERRLPLLVGGARDRPSRQQTLRATIDWSHGLLSPAERTLFARLSVFAGGCSLESAEAVCDAQGNLGLDVLEGVTSLLDKSLVFTREGTEGTRVAMLQTIHEYAAERLQASGDAEAVTARHGEHFLEMAESAEHKLWGADQHRWFTRLDVEHDNLRAALAWALALPDPEAATRLVAALGAYWEGRGHVAEAHRWFARALASGPSSAASRGKALLAESRIVLIIEEDAARARPLLEEALELLTAAGDSRRVVVALSHLALVLRTVGEGLRADTMFARSVVMAREADDAWALALALNNQASDLGEQGGDLGLARSLGEEALALRRTLGEPRGIAVTLGLLASLALAEGDAEPAISRYEESLALVEAVGLVPLIASMLGGLALATVHQGDTQRARSMLGRALRLARELGDPVTTAQCFTAAAGVAAHDGDPLQAARLCGAAARLHDGLGWTSAETRTVAEGVLAAARARAGDEQVDEALAGGEGIPVDLAVDEVLAMTDAQ